MARGRRALDLHSVEQWEQLVRDSEAKVQRAADWHGAGSREHNAAVYELRRAEQWRDAASEEQQHQHRFDGRDDRDVAREVADRVRGHY